MIGIISFLFQDRKLKLRALNNLSPVLQWVSERARIQMVGLILKSRFFHWASSRLSSLSPCLGQPLAAWFPSHRKWHWLCGTVCHLFWCRWTGFVIPGQVGGGAAYSCVCRSMGQGRLALLQQAACLLAILSYEWAMCALLGRVLICKSYGDKCYDKQDIYDPDATGHKSQYVTCTFTIFDSNGTGWK